MTYAKCWDILNCSITISNLNLTFSHQFFGIHLSPRRGWTESGCLVCDHPKRWRLKTIFSWTTSAACSEWLVVLVMEKIRLTTSYVLEILCQLAQDFFHQQYHMTSWNQHVHRFLSLLFVSFSFFNLLLGCHPSRQDLLSSWLRRCVSLPCKGVGSVSGMRCFPSIPKILTTRPSKKPSLPFSPLGPL